MPQLSFYPLRGAMLMGLFFSGFLPLYAAQPTADHASRFGLSDTAPKARNAAVSVAWQNVPLREAVVRMGQSQRLSVWIDRRVDPTHPTTLKVNRTATATLFENAAEQGGAASLSVGKFYYVGTPQSVEEIRTLLALAQQQTLQLDDEPRQAMLAKASVRVPRLTEPRDLVTSLAQRGHVRLEGLDRVPHDLWPESQLPYLSTTDQLTLVLAGFDLTWQAKPDGKTLRIVPIERPVTIRLQHDRQQVAEAIADGSSLRAEKATDPNQVWVVATVEQHEQLLGKTPRTTPTARSPKQPTNTKQVFTLRVAEQPAGAIVKQLAQQLGMELKVAPEVTTAMLNTRVTFEVDKADLDQLLTATCHPAGLAVEVKQGTIYLTVGQD